MRKCSWTRYCNIYVEVNSVMTSQIVYEMGWTTNTKVILKSLKLFGRTFM